MTPKSPMWVDMRGGSGINRASNSEPSIAINPANPKEIDIFALTAGWGADAPIWHSTNGGKHLVARLYHSQPNGLVRVRVPM
jgi:hypothetical protein